MEKEIPQRLMADEEAVVIKPDGGLDGGSFDVGAPAPGVAQPDGGEQVDGGGGGTPVGDGDAPEDVLRASLGDFLDDIEVAAFVKHSHIGKLQLGPEAPEALVFETDFSVGELFLRIFVERLGVGVGGGRIEVVVALFHILPVVALVPAETEEALLENGVLAIPQGGGKAEAAAAVAPALEAVLTPAVGAAAGLVVGEGGP